MSKKAIICEYNPFHNGHKFQIETQKKSADDKIITVMSGNFVQRGRPAICDKWQRTKMALSGGSDLVIELPVVFATQSAERFARGGVTLIDKLGVADFLCFGSECQDIEKLKDIAKLILSDETEQKINILLKKGISYPQARSEALGKEFSDIVDKPNNILAIEYIKALCEEKSSVTPVSIKREGCNHDDDMPDGNFASASYVRNCITEETDFKSFVPQTTSEILRNADVYKNTKALDSIITYLLRTYKASDLKDIADMTEGLEYRFIEAAKECLTFEDVSQFVKTKRYTKTRIDRLLINILLNIKKDDIDVSPQYIRVLGFNEKGKELLSEIKEKSSLPIITNVKDAKLCPDGENMLKKDIYATDVYMSLLGKGKSGLDYLTSPIIIK